MKSLPNDLDVTLNTDQQLDQTRLTVHARTEK